MAIERIIGIDFGTSISVLRVKRYENGEPVGDRLETKPVTFNSGNTMVPTLIRKLETGHYYGYEAQSPRRNSKLYQNFKVKLESGDEAERTEARALTEEFFKYLADEYKAQSEGGFFGAASDQEKTIVSYPVKWSDETKAFMIEAAKKAGFKNAEGMDEAQAAIQAVTVQNADMLSRKGYFTAGQPVNILLVDMGAGTTDMVLCRHTPGESGNTQILATWPKDGNVLFGGHEVDELLVEYMRNKLPEDKAEILLKRCGVEKFKAWKENYVSGALARRESVDDFSDLVSIADDLEIDIEPYALNRAEFEALAAEYLKGLPELLKGCLNEAKRDGAQIDLVILTGGHSQWYFARELLLNKDAGLAKIASDENRLISIVRPQETVALGLTYGLMVKQTYDNRDDILSEILSETEGYLYPFRAPGKRGLKNGKYGYIKGKCGYKNRNGDLVIPCSWDDARAFCEGLAAVKSGDKWGFIDETGRVVLPYRWDEASNFNNEMAVVESGEECRIIDKTGRTVLKGSVEEASDYYAAILSLRDE